MKKYGIVILSAIIILGILILMFQVRYPVKADGSNLLGQVEKVLEQLQVDYQTVAIERTLDIGKNKYAVITVDDYLGSVSLKKGLNGGYCITELTYGQSIIRGIVDQNPKAQRVIVFGHNIAQQIKTIHFTIGNISYEVQVSAEEYFIVYLPIDVPEVDTDVQNIKLYDREGNDITKIFYRNLKQ